MSEALTWNGKEANNGLTWFYLEMVYFVVVQMCDKSLDSIKQDLLI